MGRGRAKGKKITHDDQGTGEEANIPVPAQKRRGRPHKSHEEDEHSEETMPKRKKEEPVKEEAEQEPKKNGLRHNGSRRKSKPRRAAEAVVECN